MDEAEEEVLLQFDFEDTMNAKKKALVVSNSSSNLTASVVPLPAAAAAAAVALGTSVVKKEEAGGVASGTAAALDSCDKEKMDVLKNKEKKPYFDIFADDDEYESVSELVGRRFVVCTVESSLPDAFFLREPKTCWTSTKLPRPMRRETLVSI